MSMVSIPDTSVSVCFSMFQYVSVCFSMFQYVSVCFSMFQYVSVLYSVPSFTILCLGDLRRETSCAEFAETQRKK